MGNQYTSVTITGYNANPPVDDGSQTEANRLKWSTIKTKLPDPLKTAIEAVNTNAAAAFGKIDGGVTSTAVDYQVVSGDQGKLVRVTVSGKIVTTPDATDVDAPFVFGFLNDSDGDITLDGSGSQTIDGDATVTVPAGAGGRIRTDGTNWFTDGQNFQRTQVFPQGYLSLLDSATSPFSAVPASDQSGKTAVYYRTDKGNLLPIPDGTRFNVREFSELTLTLVAAHAANTLLDVFAALDPATGAVIIGTGPAWTTVTAGSGARGTGAGTTELEKLKGLPVNKVAITLRNSSTTYSISAKCAIYLGTLSMDGTNGQISCHVAWGQSRKWGVWNAYNRLDIFVKGGTSGNSSSASITPVAIGGDATATVTVLHGLADEMVHARASIKAGLAGGAGIRAGVGWNVQNAFSGIAMTWANGATNSAEAAAIGEYTVLPGAPGLHTVTLMGASLAAGTTSITGGEANNTLLVGWRG